MTTVSVHALSSGTFTLPEHMLVSPSKPGAKRTIPSLSFLIEHTPGGSDAQSAPVRIVFDLGLRRNLEDYPEALQKRLQSRRPIETVPCVVDSLRAGNLGPEQIDWVILSHLHFDHIGSPWHFPVSRFIVGPQTLGLLDGSLKLAGSQHNFDKVELPLDRTLELPALGQSIPVGLDMGTGRDHITTMSWQPLGPFPHSIDVFHDQSFFIVSAPGHVPGHIIVVARVSNLPLRWVLLAGDAFHDQHLLDGTKDFGFWQDADGCLVCFHADQEAAKQTIANIRQVRDAGLLGGNVEVIYAHDEQWAASARRLGRFWPGCL